MIIPPIKKTKRRRKNGSTYFFIRIVFITLRHWKFRSSGSNRNSEISEDGPFTYSTCSILPHCLSKLLLLILLLIFRSEVLLMRLHQRISAFEQMRYMLFRFVAYFIGFNNLLRNQWLRKHDRC